MADGPMHYWRLNELSGIVAADEKGTANGTISPGVQLGQPSVIKGETSMGFNTLAGVQAFFTLPSIMTIEAWVFRTGPGGGAARIWESEGSRFDFAVFSGTGMVWCRIIFSDSTDTGWIVTNVPVSNNVWTHLVMVWDGTALRISKNGVEVYTNNTWAGKVVTGRNSGVISESEGSGFDGLIDEVAVYAKVLTPAQIQNHYNVAVVLPTLTGYPAAIMADGALVHWRLNEIAGTVAKDSIGSRDGTISGGVTLGVPGAAGGSKAMAFDGTTGVVSCPPVPSLAGDHSLEVWASVPQKAGDVANLLVRDGFSPGCWTVAWQSQVSGGGYVKVNHPAILNTNSSAWHPYTWHHIVVVYVGTMMTVFVDGVFDYQQTVNFVDNSASTSITIGRSIAGLTGSLAATIQNAAIYPLALTPAQVLDHYNKGLLSTGGSSDQSKGRFRTRR
jgi:hypothetical protein